MQTTNHFDLENVLLPLQSNNQEAIVYEVYADSKVADSVSTKDAIVDDCNFEKVTKVV